MRLDVLLTTAELQPADVAGKVVAVIDVLRASTSIAVALHHGARGVIPVASPEEAAAQAKALEHDGVLLAGERRMQPVAGFDLGNSPLEFTPAAVGGKTLVMTTTNGTAALLATAGARDVVVASYVNLTVVVALLRAATRSGADAVLVCAGSERHFSLEDAACAGRIAKLVAARPGTVALGDAALASILIDRRYATNLTRLFADSTHGKALTEAGFAGDLAVCAALDAYPVVPVYRDRQITLLAHRER